MLQEYIEKIADPREQHKIGALTTMPFSLASFSPTCDFMRQPCGTETLACRFYGGLSFFYVLPNDFFAKLLKRRSILRRSFPNDFFIYGDMGVNNDATHQAKRMAAEVE